MNSDSVYFLRKKRDKRDREYFIVTDKPAIVIVEIVGIPVGVPVRNLRKGVIYPIESILNQNFRIGDRVPGYSFTNNMVKGTTNLYDILKID